MVFFLLLKVHLGHWEPLQVGLHILFTGLSSSDSFLAFWHKLSQAYLIHIQSQPWCQSFLQGALVLSGGKWCWKEHNHFKSPSPVEVKQISSAHNHWSDLFWYSQGRQMLQSRLTIFKILASGWPCRKGPWRKAQKNQAQLSLHPSHRATGQELTGVRRCFPGDLLPLLTKLISETKCAGLPPHNGAIAKCVIVCVQRRRGNVSKGFWQGLYNSKLTSTLSTKCHLYHHCTEEENEAQSRHIISKRWATV